MMTDFFPRSFQRDKSNGTRALCGVLDGHSGAAVAEYAAKRLPEIFQTQPWWNSRETPTDAEVEKAMQTAFMSTDAEVISLTQSGNLVGGSTANVGLLVAQTLYIANIGDTRAVLSRAGFAHELSQDHKPDRPSERARIEALDGRVEWRGCWRVMGGNGAAAFRGLAISRAFGDIDWKVPTPLVDACPEVRSCRLTSDDEFLIIGCDGVWDVMSSQDAVDLARQHALPIVGADDGAGGLGDRAATAAAKAIAQTALERGSMDNITVVVMTLLR